MKLLGWQNIGGRILRDWLHIGDDGKKKITTETVQDVEPIFDRAKRLTEMNVSRDFRFKASIPLTVVDEVCTRVAPVWGMKPIEVYRELIAAKTARAKKIWRLLCHDRNYRKFQRA